MVKKAPFPKDVEASIDRLIDELAGQDSRAKVAEWKRYHPKDNDADMAIIGLAAFANTQRPGAIDPADAGPAIIKSMRVYLTQRVLPARVEMLMPYIESFCAFVFGERLDSHPSAEDAASVAIKDEALEARPETPPDTFGAGANETTGPNSDEAPSRPVFEHQAVATPQGHVAQNRFDYPRVFRIQVDMDFGRLQLDARQDASLVPSVDQARALQQVIFFLDKHLPGSLLKEKLQTSAATRRLFTSTFRDPGKSVTLRVREIGVTNTQGDFLPSFVARWNDPDQRVALQRWAKDYEDYLRVLAAQRLAAEAAAAPSL
jgi:hypothetical protein